MGSKLLAFYDEAQKIGGIKGKMRIAMLTGISSVKAGSEPDSPENIKKFTDGISELKKEFK